MHNFVLFTILGLGAGDVYALLGLGLVLVYKGSGIVNFAQGAIGMAGTVSVRTSCRSWYSGVPRACLGAVMVIAFAFGRDPALRAVQLACARRRF